MTHIKRDSDCNGNEKENSEKQPEGKSQKIFYFIFKLNILGNLQGAWDGEECN